jgi:hypothetical protein
MLHESFIVVNVPKFDTNLVKNVKISLFMDVYAFVLYAYVVVDL